MALDIRDMTLRGPASWNSSARRRARDIALGQRDQWRAFAELNPVHARSGFILAKRQRGEYVVKLCYGDPVSGSFVPVIVTYG